MTDSAEILDGASGVAYAELCCATNFTFLLGASHPEEMVQRARELGYRALAITDACSLAGAVRAWQAGRQLGLLVHVGTQVRLVEGPRLTILARNREGYRALCRLITYARRSADKGHYRLTQADLHAHDWGSLPGCEVLWHLEPGTDAKHRDREWSAWVLQQFPRDIVHLAVALLRTPEDSSLVARALALQRDTGLSVVACGDVVMHVRGRRALQDVLTALRLKSTLAEAADALAPNGERHLRELADLVALHPREWLDATVAVSARCHFQLDEVVYDYPSDVIPAGIQPSSWLRQLVEAGCRERWPSGTPPRVWQQIERELGIIAELGYEAYFLTVHDLVRFARGRGILCQGRGSAANSAVCYALGITAVDPARANMLFERFISKERNEPPDIDVDFEHERREEVIQYLYQRYGRERAALAATVIRYRRRSALRDVGRALGISRARLDALTANMAWWDEGIPEERLREAGIDPQGNLARQWRTLAETLRGFPRHLSQHTGGFVIAAGRLDECIPIENAAMPGRTVIQWDKDDLDAMGFLKIDVLALGMLSCMRRALELLAMHRGRKWGLADIPSEDKAVYRMLCAADTVGVFQIESRAQMSMLPRLCPRSFYDLVIEIAIVRPGPIQGQMVHPYLRRRQGLEAVDYPNLEVKRVLERTLGIPIFQEQVIELAMVAAGFSAGEADGLRRAIGAWRRSGALADYRERLLHGMEQRGFPKAFAERIYQQILGFGEYGFPESHAASFALITYVSAWFKCHEPALFACALLNSQPMGFYAPAQIIADARRHGVEVRPVDINRSLVESSLEARSAGHDWSAGSAKRRGPGTDLALRLGLNRIRGLHLDTMQSIVSARVQGAFGSIQELVNRTGIERSTLARLARAGALANLAGHRHLAHWEARAVETSLPLFPESGASDPKRVVPLLPVPTVAEDVAQDYASTGLSLGPHPLLLLRAQPAIARIPTAEVLIHGGARRHARHIGLVITRQRPGSANGTVFLTLEDESGVLNVIVWASLVESFRQEILTARLLEVHGELQQSEGVTHLLAQRLIDRSEWLGDLVHQSRDFG